MPEPKHACDGRHAFHPPIAISDNIEQQSDAIVAVGATRLCNNVNLAGWPERRQ